MLLGIIGNGFVGSATQILKSDTINTCVYDIDPNRCNPVGTTLEDIVKCDIIFICVPTPMNEDGSCNLSIIENVISNLKSLCDFNEKLIVLRSTVTPGTADNYNTYFMPEFLTEKNYVNDFITNKNWIFGLKGTEQDIQFKENIETMINLSHRSGNIKCNKITFRTNKEAEMIKLFRNNFLSVKVSFCNEIYDYCKLKEIDYEKVVEIAAADDRIGLSHTLVPGPDGLRGYGGTCFPKDISNTLFDMGKNGMTSYILESSFNRNKELDRKDDL
jgi:UDPglucose 6-dehydrogenase